MKHIAYTNKNGEPIDLAVRVLTRPNLRSGEHEMVMYSGKKFLDNIFDTKVVDPTVEHVFMYYPESWANIPELQCLVEWIPYFYPNVTKVDIDTHSVYIIQTVRAEQIGIYDKPDDYPCVCKPTDHLAPPPREFGGLRVFHP